MVAMGELSKPGPWLPLHHANSQHPYRFGFGGYVLCLDRCCTGALCQQRRQWPQQSLDLGGRPGMGGPSAFELGRKRICGVSLEFNN